VDMGNKGLCLARLGRSEGWVHVLSRSRSNAARRDRESDTIYLEYMGWVRRTGLRRERRSMGRRGSLFILFYLYLFLKHFIGGDGSCIV
jgi:hypothetical protein